MPCPPRMLPLLLAVWMLPACPTAPNPDYTPGGTVDGGGIDAIMYDADPLAPDSKPACSQTMPCASDQGAPICGEDGMCVSCNERAQPDQDCAARDNAYPRCDPVGGDCVVCLIATDCPTLTAPVCDQGSHTCRACQADDECPARVCLDSGQCADPASVLYVDHDTGTTDAACTLSDPCDDISVAVSKLSAGVEFVRVLDQGPKAVTIALTGVTVTIVGVAGGTELNGNFNGAPVLDVGAGATVRVRNLEINQSNGVGVICQAPGSSSVQLVDVRVVDSDEIGVTSDGCDLTIERSDIAGNRLGGVSIRNGSFRLVNNLIVDNGSGAADFGGVRIDNAAASPTAQEFAFNTVDGNNAAASAATGSRGVSCTGPASAPIAATGNIVRGGTGGPNIMAGAECSFAYSNLEGAATLGDLAAGGNNVDAAPSYVNAGTGDYHLAADDDTCTGRADPSAGVAVDRDGEDRPQGGATPDIGADEIDESAGS